MMDEKGLTAYALAQTSTFSESYLQMLKRGEIDKPRGKTINRLAAALDVPVAALLGDQPNVTHVTVSLPEDLVDVLHALAAVQRTSIEAVVEPEVRDYVRRRGSEPGIRSVVDAMRSARKPDVTSSGELGSS